jgi:insulysin
MMEIAHKFNGTVNAYTQYDHTAYYFRCDANGLRSMLEILSDSVSKPLLDHQAVLREVEAVDSEFSMKQNSDITRCKFQLINI